MVRGNDMALPCNEGRTSGGWCRTTIASWLGEVPHAACCRAAQAVNLSPGSPSNKSANKATSVEQTALRTTVGAEASREGTPADTPDDSNFSNGANCDRRGNYFMP